MRVYFIRHGQTEWNRDKIVQGHTSVKLTEKGMKQAERVKETLSDVHFDRMIASDLYRTRQTAGIIFGEDANIEYDERVREINNTPLAGRTRDDLIAEFGDKFIYASRSLDFSYFGGESAKELVARVGAFLDDLAKDTESENIAVVTHGGVVHAVVANVLCVGDTIKMDAFGVGNCTVSVVEYKNDRWKLIHLNNKTEID